jgi:hypothetical protein
MKMNYQGQSYDFPEGTSFEEINEFLGNSSINTKAEKPQPLTKEQGLEAFKDVTGIGKPGLGQEFVGGLLSGVKSLGQAIPDLANMVPENMRNVLLYPNPGERPIDKWDPYKMMGTEDKSFLTPGGAMQTIGELAVPFPFMAKGANKIGSSIKNALNEFKPAKESENFLQNLGNGRTATENAERVAETINTSAQNQKGYALAHEKKVKEAIAKEKLDKVPNKELPEGNLDKVASLFGKKAKDVSPDEVKELSEAVKRFRKHNDFDQFKDEAEFIFGHKGLGSSQIKNLEEMMNVSHLRDLNYLNPKNEQFLKKYGYGLKELHNAFSKSKNFATAHDLESGLGKEIGKLKDRRAKGTLDTNGDNKLEALEKMYKDLRKDMDVLVKDMPKHVQDNWKEFKRKYKENYKVYESTAALKEMSRGETIGTTPATITKTFAHPTKEVKKILGDLPQEGKNYIVYNELAHINPKDPQKVVNAFHEMKQSGGFGEYITPEMDNAIATMERKLGNLKRAKKYGKVTGYGLGGIGALGGAVAGTNKLIDILSK